MARIRTIKPEFFANEKLSELPASTHLLAAALLCYADDEGYFNANTKLIRSSCCPLRDSTVPVSESLRSLAEIGYLRLGVCGADGREYGQIVNFSNHQTINKARPSKIKSCDIKWRDYGSPTVSLPCGMEQGMEQGTGNGSGAADAANDSQSTQAATRAENVPLPASLDSPSFLAVRDSWFAQRRRKRLSLRPEFIARQYERLAPLGADRAAACVLNTVDNDYDGLFPEKFGGSHGKPIRTIHRVK